MSGKIQFTAGEINAFVEGSVGWAAACPTLRLPDGKELTFRETSVLHQEAGEWKIVQHHISIGVPNAEILGE